MSLSAALHSLTRRRVASVAHNAVRSSLTQRRHASFYNADLAGLTEEQAEVRMQTMEFNEHILIRLNSSAMLLQNSPRRRLHLERQTLT